MIPRKTKVRIGDMLVSNGEITEEQLQAALTEQRVSGRKLGRILVDKSFIDEDRFLKFLSEQFGIPFIDLKHVNFEPGLVGRLPETYARRYRAIVLEEKNGELLLGMADPMDVFAYDELARQLKQPVALAVVRESELLAMLDLAYRRTGDIVQYCRRTRRRTVRRSVFAGRDRWVGRGLVESGGAPAAVDHGRCGTDTRIRRAYRARRNRVAYSPARGRGAAGNHHQRNAHCGGFGFAAQADCRTRHLGKTVAPGRAFRNARQRAATSTCVYRRCRCNTANRW